MSSPVARSGGLTSLRQGAARGLTADRAGGHRAPDPARELVLKALPRLVADLVAEIRALDRRIAKAAADIAAAVETQENHPLVRKVHMI